MQSFWLTMDKWLNCITLNLMNYMKTFLLTVKKYCMRSTTNWYSCQESSSSAQGFQILPNIGVLLHCFSLSLSPLNCSFSLKKNQLKLLLTSCINQIINWSEIPVRGPLSLEPLLSRWELTFECTVCTWNETYVTVVSFTEIISVIDMTYFLSRKMTKSYHLIW